MSLPTSETGKDLGASASRPGSRERSPSVSAASGFDPSRVEYGKYGLPITDELSIDALAGCLERLWTGGGGEMGVYTIAAERGRLRHALAAFMIRAITPRDDKWRDLPRDSDGSGEAGETGTGSTVGDSAGPKDIAQTTAAHDKGQDRG